MALAISSMAMAQPQLRPDNVDEILGAMTLEEKAALLVGSSTLKLVNGVISGEGSAVPGAAGSTTAIPRLGIPSTVLADGPAGVRINPTRDGDSKTYYATGFPVGTLLASSWDTDMVKKVTAAMGNEVHEYGVDVLLAPGLNIHRNPLCGRNFEYFSEDPVLAGKMAAAYVNGIQSNGVGVSIKHFAANNQETNRGDNDSQVSQRALRELYLKNFEICVKESHPWTVMSSYNQVNGTYAQQSHGLLTDILRDEWGFDGIVMTDWGNKEGTVKAVKAGNDLMEPGDPTEVQRIIEAVKSGAISQEELDRNVRNMLNYIVKTPVFKKYKFSNSPDLKAHAETARESAANSMVLLRNERQTLPLAGNEKVALFGISSLDFVAGGTGSGDVNKAYVANMEDAMKNAGFSVDSELAEFYRCSVAQKKAESALGTENNLLAKLIAMFKGNKQAEIALPEKAYTKLAAQNDVAVVVLGRNAGEGSDRKLKDDFSLTNIESELLREVSDAFHAVGKKVIVVLNIGGVIETVSWKSMADAILLPWSPGQEGANAVADVMTGKVNPSGKLPMTFPMSYFDVPSSANFPYTTESTESNSLAALFQQQTKKKNVDYTAYDEGIWVGYRYFTTKGVEVSYPFGYGLSYTTFGYSKPVVKSGTDGFTASITVTNNGSVAGRESVQLYVAAPAGGLEKPSMELKSFAKTKLLAPGESETLTMKVDTYSLASFNESASQWETAAGEYGVMFGANVTDIRCKGAFLLAKASSWPVHNVLAPESK